MSRMTPRDWIRRALALEYGGEDKVETSVGELDLADFQRRAARRGASMARTFGGVLIADAVGLGKTRVALSIASTLARDRRKLTHSRADVLCLGPARLEAQWRLAAERAGLTDFNFCSHTRLSRQGSIADRPSVILVDEAHRFRNPSARRSRALAELAEHGTCVLLTATPVCNSIMDLYHLLSVFCAEEDFRTRVGYDLLGAFEAAKSGEFDITELLQHVVIRRCSPPDGGGFGRRPAVRLDMLRYDAVEDEAWLWRHLESHLNQLSLVLLRDNWPRALFTEYIMKRWESGPRALADSLEKLVEFHRRWLQAEACGRGLSRADFESLFGRASHMRQEVFSFVYSPEESARDVKRATVQQDLEGLILIHERASRLARTGDGRVKAVVDLAATLDSKLLAFSSYQSAAEELYRALATALGSTAKVALVTGQHATATGLGRTSCEEVLRRFAPAAHGFSSLEPHQQLDILVATDCLSEGVNLQDCSHVVLADLPYSPVAIEQRVGRLVRPGAPQDTVHVYLPRPRAWSDSLGLRRRLRGKLHEAAEAGARHATSTTLLITAAESPAEQAVDDPLGALTRLDRLAETLDAAGAPLLVPGDFRAVGHRGPDVLWTRYAISVGNEPRFGWLRTTTSNGAEARIGRNLPWLIEASEAPLELESGTGSVELVVTASHHLRSRERRLKSARAAPRQVSFSSPQRRLWQVLREGMETGVIDVDQNDVDRMRQIVLRAHTRGIRRRIGHVVDQGLDPCAALELVKGLSGGEAVGPVEVEVLGQMSLVRE